MLFHKIWNEINDFMEIHIKKKKKLVLLPIPIRPFQTKLADKKTG